MHYVEALDKPVFLNTGIPIVFLAGGITNCHEWQKDFIDKVEEIEKERGRKVNAIFLNPRRKNFPIHDPNAYKEQITWEFDMLYRSDIIGYWFAKETVQPIVLFELGKFLNSDKWIRIGIHPDYPCRKDVEVQVGLERKGYPFTYSFTQHVHNVVEAVDDLCKFRKWKGLI
jgi:hypothetical protein